MKFKKGLFLLLILISLSFWKLGVFNIAGIDVEIKNAQCVNEQNIKSDLNLLGKNILFFDEYEASRKLTVKYPCIKNIDFKRQLSKEIKVFISGRNPFLSVAPLTKSPLSSLDNLEATPSSSTAFLDWSLPSQEREQLTVDETGVVFDCGDNSDLPLIFLPDENLKIGQKLDDSLFIKISEIVTKLTQFQIQNFHAKVENHDLVIQTSPQLVFALDKDALKQLASLQLILAKAKMNETMIKSIDLRFDKPVVVYASFI